MNYKATEGQRKSAARKQRPEKEPKIIAEQEEEKEGDEEADFFYSYRSSKDLK